MSRVSKIRHGHEDSHPRNDCTFSVIADPRSPAGITTPEQADAHHEAALASRSTRRAGKAIEERNDEGGWVLKQGYRYINEAKQANRPIAPAKAR